MTRPQDPTLRDARDAQVVALAEQVGALLAPTVAQHDRAGTFAHDHLALLHAHGVLGLTVPRDLGGQGLSLYRTLLFQQRLGRHAPATALCLGWHLMAFGCLAHHRGWEPQALARLARDVIEDGQLINVLVTERQGGNLLRGARPTTRARWRGDHWVLDGHKAFCSGAPALQQMVVYASLEGDHHNAEFLVPRGPGVRVVETWDTLGMRSTASHDISFDGVVLPPQALVHRYGPGPDRPSSFSVGSRAWGLQLPALYLGIAEAARDQALAFADGYAPPSLGHAVLDAPSVQARLGEIEFLIGAARAQLYGVAERWERHPALQESLHDEVAITKVVVSRQAVQAVELAVEIVGGHALDRGHVLERLWRDVRCSAFNPPQADTVVAGLARTATAAWRTPAPVAADKTSTSAAEPALAALA